MLIDLRDKVAVVTGAGSGIGHATALELARREVKSVAVVDIDPAVEHTAQEINQTARTPIARAFVGDVTDDAFRRRVFSEIESQFGVPDVLVPAAGITRDALAVKCADSGDCQIYPIETFRLVTEVNLVAPIYWALELIARLAADRKARGLGRWRPEESVQGTVVFIGSVSSQGNRGQLSYATTKAGLEGAAATLNKEGMYHGVRCNVIHPGFTDTPMVRALGEDFIREKVLPYTQLGRLIAPEEIADAICFMIANSAVSGELWVDAGWHPSV